MSGQQPTDDDYTVAVAEFVSDEPYEFPNPTRAELAETNGSPSRELELRPVWRPAPSSFDVVDGWVLRARAVFHLAEELAPTDFVPDHLRNKPAAVAACILTGRELGLGPMTSLRHVQVVKGTPTLSAEYKRARVLGAGHRFDIIERTASRCIIEAQRRGSRRPPVRFAYDLEDARRAKLLKPDSAWATRPRRMLFARCSSEVCDAMFSDVTNGLPTTELIEAGEFDEYAGYDEPPAGAASGEAGQPQRTAQRKTPAKQPARTAGPDPESATSGSPAGSGEQVEPEGAKRQGREDPDVATLNPKHPLHKKLMAQFNEIGVKERALRLRACGALGGTTVDSLDHLTVTQAQAVADALDECIAHARNAEPGEGEGGHLTDQQRHIAYQTLGTLVRTEEERRTRADNHELADPPPATGQAAPAQQRGSEPPLDDDPGPPEPPLGADE